MNQSTRRTAICRIGGGLFLCGAGGHWIGPDALAGEIAPPRVNVPTVAQIRARDEKLWKLVDLINAYRHSHGLQTVELSPRLSAVAARHVMDLASNSPQETYGSLHSWSPDERWTGGAFRLGDEKTYRVMWDKPREIAAYDSNGYEVAASGARDMPHALELWKNSPPHNEVILNLTIWKRLRWRALGAVFHEGFACAWFGEKEDV